MLEFKNLVVGQKDFNLELGNIYFSKPELITLLGPNGSGKSTLLKTLAGLQPAISGEFLTKEVSVYVPAQPQIQEGVYGFDLFELYEVDNRSTQYDAILQALNIKSFLDKNLFILSSGERHRVLLAAALLTSKKILLLDEPFAHLDWFYIDNLCHLLQSAVENNRLVIVTTHDYNTALRFQRGLAIDNGRVLVDESVENVLTHPKVQSAFKFKSQIVTNPLNGDKLLALTAYEEQRP